MMQWPQELEFGIRRSVLGAEGNAFIRFEATVSVFDGNHVDVAVKSVMFDPSNEHVEAARQAIHEGCANALKPHCLAANVTVRNLSIHPVDFVPRMITLWTQGELSRRILEHQKSI